MLLAAGVVSLSGCATGGGGGGEEGVDSSTFKETANTRTANLRLIQAEEAGQTQHFPEALQYAMNEIADNPSNAIGYYQAARAQAGMGDYVAADTLFKRAVELYPDYQGEISYYREMAWIASFNQSIAASDQGDTDGILKALEEAEQVFPGRRPEALYNLGLHYSTLGRNEEAIEKLGAALEVLRGPRPVELLSSGQPSDSALVADWMTLEEPVTFNRARVLSDQGRHAEVAEEYRAFLERHPGHITARSNMAVSLAAAGDTAAAEAIYNDLLGGDNLGLRDYFNVGVGLYQAQQSAKAADAFRKVVDESPQNRDALLNLVVSLYEAGDHDGCVQFARELVDLDEYAMENYMMLAKCLAEADQSLEGGKVIEASESLRFTISGAGLEPLMGGGGVVTGNLTNNTLEPGAGITIRVHFNGEDGASVGTTTLRLEAPEQGETVSFRADFTSEESVLGFYFQVIPPR